MVKDIVERNLAARKRVSGARDEVVKDRFVEVYKEQKLVKR